MAGVAIIANPHAHRNRLWPLAAQALRKAAPGAALFETRTEAELGAAVRALHADPPDVVAIAGGDGTVTHTVTALTRQFGDRVPRLALLGGGAFDSLASLGGAGAAEDRLRRLAVAVGSGAQLEQTERDTLRVAGRCGFRFGAGLPVRFVEEVAAGGPAGTWRSGRFLLRAIVSSLRRGSFASQLYAPLDLRVVVGEEEWPPVDLYGIVCASVAEAGLGTRPFRRATEQPGAFEVLGLTAGPLQFALELPRLMLGRHVRRDRLLDAVAERVRLSSPKPFRWFLDGEIDTCRGSLTVELGPRVTLVRA